MHLIHQSAFLEEALHLGHLLGHRGGRRAERDEAEVCDACFWRGKRCEVDGGHFEILLGWDGIN